MGCGDRPPVSCFADGVQLGSGCTTGKGNLRVEVAASGKPEATVSFRKRPSGGPVGNGGAPGHGNGGARVRGRATDGCAPGGPAVSLTVRVRPAVEVLGARWLQEAGDREAARRLLELSDEELFEVEEG